MNEKQKAYTSFEAIMERVIRSAETSRDRRVRKLMNATVDGVEYQSEEEIMDAFAWEMITDNDRYRLLKALEYKNDRPRLKEDYMIAFCRQALHLVYDEQSADARDQKQREIRGKTVEIQRNGGTALVCACCGDVIGETDRDGQHHEYLNCKECAAGRVCADCLRNCRNQCKNS